MKVHVPVLLVVFFVFVVAPVGAQNRTKGPEILEACTEAAKPVDSADLMQTARCLGFIDGFIQGMEIVKLRQHPNYDEYLKSTILGMDIPDGVTNGQIARVFVKWLNAHPQHLHLEAGMLLTLALAETYPAKS